MPSAMRSLALVLLLAPALASARPWQGITPGTSTQQEVAERFGEPTTRTKRTGRVILAYYGDQALSGTRQAQFHVSDAGVVQEITIFLTAQLDADTIEGTYGRPPQKTFVEDTFQKVWVYPSHGVTVYFGKDGLVEALSFSAGRKGAPAAAPATAAADAPAPSTAAQPQPAAAAAR